MTKNENKVVATLTFTADKMMPKMKKCLVKDEVYEYCKYPALEVDSGLLLATQGHVLAAHKLRDYHYEQRGNACISHSVMLPVDVLKMRGAVTVEITTDCYRTTAVAHDTKGATVSLTCEQKYPMWRTAIPRATSWPISVDAKQWDDILKELMPKLNEIRRVHLHAEKESKALTMDYENYDNNDSGRAVLEVPEPIPCKVAESFDARQLRDMMAFGFTTMRFVGGNRPMLFYNDETLAILMPYMNSLAGDIDKRDIDYFDLDKWVTAGSSAKEQPAKKAAAEPQPAAKAAVTELSPAERLRLIMLAVMKQAA